MLCEGYLKKINLEQKMDKSIFCDKYVFSVFCSITQKFQYLFFVTSSELYKEKICPHISTVIILKS